MKRLISVFCLSFAACGVNDAQLVDGATMSWEEFRAQVVQEPDTGAFITNGDELVEEEQELEQMYQRYLDEQNGLRTTGQELVVNQNRGRDDRWSEAVARNLTYCVSRSSFGANYDVVVKAMTSAAADWEAAGNVDFVHQVALDDNCSQRTNVIFNVRLGTSGSYLARAFFPSSSRSRREIIIDESSFGRIAPWTLEGILRHELGHVLGFRHEHTRPESGRCFENSSWRSLTTYDSASVMHYPHCNGTRRGDLVLTARDRKGVALLYPSQAAE